MSSKRWHWKWIFGKSHDFGLESVSVCSDSSRSLYTYHHKFFWRLKKRKTYFQEFIKASNMPLAILNGLISMELKTRIHINLNIASKELQQKVSCCLLFKQIMKNKDRNLWALHPVTIPRRMKRCYTFERSSNFAPSENSRPKISSKWQSPLHRGKAEILIKH